MRTPGNITAIDSEVLNIKVKPGQDSNPQFLKIMSWNVTKFSGN